MTPREFSASLLREVRPQGDKARAVGALLERIVSTDPEPSRFESELLALSNSSDSAAPAARWVLKAWRQHRR